MATIQDLEAIRDDLKRMRVKAEADLAVIERIKMNALATATDNRWAAFTNDELNTLAAACLGLSHPSEMDWEGHALYAQIEAELERRRA